MVNCTCCCCRNFTCHGAFHMLLLPCLQRTILPRSNSGWGAVLAPHAGSGMCTSSWPSSSTNYVSSKKVYLPTTTITNYLEYSFAKTISLLLRKSLGIYRRRLSTLLIPALVSNSIPKMTWNILLSYIDRTNSLILSTTHRSMKINKL